MTPLCVRRRRPRLAFEFDVRGLDSGGESSIIGFRTMRRFRTSESSVRGCFQVPFFLHDALEGEGGRVSSQLQRGETPLPAR